MSSTSKQKSSHLSRLDIKGGITLTEYDACPSRHFRTTTLIYTTCVTRYTVDWNQPNISTMFFLNRHLLPLFVIISMLIPFNLHEPYDVYSPLIKLTTWKSYLYHPFRYYMHIKKHKILKGTFVSDQHIHSLLARPQDWFPFSCIWCKQ